ncbi:MAG: L-fucose/L-arabinose isomerase family protein [bacterium]
MPEKTRIGFVPAHRVPFSEDWAVDMRHRVLKAFEPVCKDFDIEVVVPDIALTKNGLVRDDKDTEKVVRLFKDRDVAGIIIGTMTFGDEISAITVAERMPGVPVLLFGTKEGAFTQDGNRRSDSFCGTLSISSGLYRRAIPFSFLGICFPEEEVFSKGIRHFVRTCVAVKGFIGARIGLVGPRPERFETCAVNESPMIEQFGQRVIPISLVDIFNRSDEVEDEKGIIRIIDKIKESADCKLIKEETLQRAARLEIVLKEFAQEKDLQALGVQCWTAVQEIYGISPCLTMGRLTEAGIMTSCEVDIHGALTMLVQYLASLKATIPHFIDWTIQHQREKDVFLAWHCGNAPMGLKARNSQIYLKSHSILGDMLGPEKCEGTAEFQLREGKVTLNRIVEYDGEFKMLITKGEIIPNKDKLRGSWSWVKVSDLENLYRTLVEEGFLHHASMIHGDISNSLVEFCRFTGMEAIIV